MNATSINIIYYTSIDFISILNCMHERNRNGERERKADSKKWTILFFLLMSKHQCKTFEFQKLFRFTYCMINTSFDVRNKSTWFISFYVCALFSSLNEYIFNALIENVRCTHKVYNFRWIKAILIRIWRVIDTIRRRTLLLSSENNCLHQNHCSCFRFQFRRHSIPALAIYHSMDLETNREDLNDDNHKNFPWNRHVCNNSFFNKNKK